MDTTINIYQLNLNFEKEMDILIEETSAREKIWIDACKASKYGDAEYEVAIRNSYYEMGYRHGLNASKLALAKVKKLLEEKA